MIGPKLSQDQIDIEITDLVLKKLFNNGEKRPASLKDDILIPNKINYNADQLDRLWDVLMNTGLVSAVIGFGRHGRLELTSQGYQLMEQFGSYSNFIKKQMEAKKQPPAPAQNEEDDNN